MTHGRQLSNDEIGEESSISPATASHSGRHRHPAYWKRTPAVVSNQMLSTISFSYALLLHSSCMLALPWLGDRGGLRNGAESAMLCISSAHVLLIGSQIQSEKMKMIPTLGVQVGAPT